MSDAYRNGTGSDATAPSNPFSTRHVRPGAIPFVFRTGDDIGQLLARLRAGGWWGEITGPHGSGKSTLVAALMHHLVGEGREPTLIELHDGERSLAGHQAAVAAVGPRSVVIVDGYEQLSLWQRWRLRRMCRRRGCGLVVTAHRSAGLPPLYETQVDATTAEAVLSHLLPAQSPVNRAELLKALDAHRGNLREALFDLYDLYEERRPRRA